MLNFEMATSFNVTSTNNRGTPVPSSAELINFMFMIVHLRFSKSLSNCYLLLFGTFGCQQPALFSVYFSFLFCQENIRIHILWKFLLNWECSDACAVYIKMPLILYIYIYTHTGHLQFCSILIITFKIVYFLVKANINSS